ncbi:acyl-CoA dehydrogenase family protein [Pseudomonas mangrovi]|uniref:Pimeloyl-CoA dehydrogenase small subunit n=1 Tax=Pseudomonas mangrovi TaxID=2161748 RepID=A0A2T5PAC7_9PSED|nr:acyl-CoA dehydrogenase [Pseudomonas mangrovi]PTU74700.1 pimeloyl-CoA dehydrogenase small subunit [Pseudomonas mangrovi]
MDFKLSEEQQMLQDTAARQVRDAYPFEKREQYSKSELGFSQDFWNQLGELGLTAVPFSEELGGFGGGGVETMLIMTELGRGLTLEPYLQSVIHGGGLLAQLGSDAQKENVLAEVAAGSLQLAVALEEPTSLYNLADVSTTAKAANGGYLLNGRKAVVIGGHSAGKIIVSARTSGGQCDEAGISLFLVDPSAAGVKRRVFPTIDGRKACELLLDNVQVALDDLLGEEGEAFAALRYQQGRAIAAQAALAVGYMQELCNLTLDYLKTRKQFGVPIGKFQVLQHRMVDMQTELEQATSMAMLAACHADAEDNAERTRVLTAAKYIVTRGARFVAEQAIQLHGGIGMTWEYNGAHYAKALVMIGHEFGDEDTALKAYAKDLEVA